MKFEYQCVSLSLAKKLKELGASQESAFVWFNNTGMEGDAFWTLGFMEELFDNGVVLYPRNTVSAFTVAELGCLLPAHRLRQIHKSPVGDCWTLPIKADEHASCRGTDHVGTEADARAKMLIYLLQNDLSSH